MISIPYAAYLCEAIYDPVPGHLFDQIIEQDSIVCGVKASAGFEKLYPA